MLKKIEKIKSKVLTMYNAISMLIHTYIHTYKSMLKIGRRCSYLVTAPLYIWKGARHNYYSCSFLLNRGVSL